MPAITATGRFGHLSTAAFTAIALPLAEDSEGSLLIIVPAKGKEVAELEVRNILTIILETFSTKAEDIILTEDPVRKDSRAGCDHGQDGGGNHEHQGDVSHPTPAVHSGAEVDLLRTPPLMI